MKGLRRWNVRDSHPAKLPPLPKQQGSKKEKEKNGRQNLLCCSCQKQFQPIYRNKGADPQIKDLVVRFLERNSGIRDIEELLGISRKCILDNLCRQGNIIKIQPAQQHYTSVQIDEVWSFVGKRKKGKHWLLYAYSPRQMRYWLIVVVAGVLRPYGSCLKS